MKTTHTLMLSALIAASASVTLAANIQRPPLQDTEVQVTFINDTNTTAHSTNTQQWQGQYPVSVTLPDLKPGEKKTINIPIVPSQTGSRIFPSLNGVVLSADWSRDYAQHGTAGTITIKSTNNIVSSDNVNSNYTVESVSYNHPIEMITIHIKNLP